MKYTEDFFDQITNRRGTGDAKYDALGMIYGTEDLTPMWVADMDFRCPVEMTEAIVNRAKVGIFGYGLDGKTYKDYVTKWHKKRNNIDYAESSVFYAKSSLLALTTGIMALTNEHDNVLVLHPTYGPLHKIPASMKRNVITSHLIRVDGEYRVDFADFEKKIIDSNVQLYILCNPHNPSGRAWSETELEQMLNICQKHQVKVISDEVHSDLIMPGYHFTPSIKVARKLNYSDNLVMMNTPSKTFNVAGLQVGYYVAEGKEVQEKMSQAAEYMHSSDLLSTFSYIGITGTYGNENGESYVDELRKYIHKNFEMAKEMLLNNDFGQNIAVTELEGTYLMWVELKNLPKDVSDLKGKFTESKVALEVSDDFFEDEGNFIRVNLSMPRALVEEGMAKIVRCIGALYGVAVVG